MFKFQHGTKCFRISNFDVTRLRHTYVAMSKDGLNHLVLHAYPMQVCRESPTKSMPSVPLDASFFQGRPNNVTCRLIQTSWITGGVSEHPTFLWRTVLVKAIVQLLGKRSNYRNGCLLVLVLRPLACLRHTDFETRISTPVWLSHHAPRNSP